MYETARVCQASWYGYLSFDYVVTSCAPIGFLTTNGSERPVAMCHIPATDISVRRGCSRIAAERGPLHRQQPSTTPSRGDDPLRPSRSKSSLE